VLGRGGFLARGAAFCGLVCVLLLALLTLAACSAPGPETAQPVPQFLRLTELLKERDIGAPAQTPGVELDRTYRPVIRGQERIEIPLPAGLFQEPREALFETWLAVEGEEQEQEQEEETGTEARFRVWVEDADGRRPVLEQDIGAAEEGPHGPWHPVAVPLRLRGPATIGLEAEVRRAGEVLPPSAALWGNPRLVTGSRPPGPNLLIVAVDTLRADVLGAWGDPHGLSPHLDAFADRSVRFADLTAPSPWTLPSFVTLLTGLAPEVHGAGRRLDPDIPGVAGDGIARLPGEVRTLAEVLSAEGFDTAGIYNNVYLRPTYGLQQGFDEYLAHPYRTQAGELTGSALRWLDAHRDRRFFLFFHLLDPHTPYTPPRKFCEEVAERWMSEAAPEAARGRCRWTRHAGGPDVPPDQRAWVEALYRAEVAFTDFHLGRLWRALDDFGLMENTVVLFVSDHGEELWEHQETERRLGYESIADHGHSLYRELLHVPGLLYVPPSVRPGWEPRTIDTPVELADFFPTLLDLLGIENASRALSGRLSGRMLTPDLWGASAGSAEPRTRLAGFLRYGPPRVAIERGGWKLVLPRTPGGPAELYHLANDPGETHNLAEAHPERLDRLRRALRRELRARAELRRALGLPAADERATPDREQVESLKALGYGN